MRKFITTLSASVVMTLAAFSTASGQDADVRVIVNSANTVSELPAAEVTNLFLKKSSKFPGGLAAAPIDQAKNCPVRSIFARKVLGRPATAIDSYWQQQIFGGGELPPAVKTTDDEVVAFVKSTPGGIGYVSASASVAGVKVLTIK